VADGDSEAEALTNLGDAIDCWLAAARANHRPIPQRDLELPTT
jgi:predicted RNase H-like HicB family nuclease